MNPSIDDLKLGYSTDPEACRCLFCGASFEQGVIHPSGDRFFDAPRAARQHVEDAHGGVFSALLSLGRPATGLTDIQQRVLELTRRGLDDRQIAQELGGKSPSTVRNHRFQLRRKYREARVFIALMELLDPAPDQQFVEFHAALPVDDDRVVITEAEARKLLDRYMGPDHNQLSRFPKKEKYKLVVLRHLVERFERERRYTEKEVNALLGEVFDDFAVLRRYLVDYRFLARERDGSAYWRVDEVRSA